MASLTEQEFKKQINSGSLPTLCLICGDEDYLKKHYVTLLEKKCVNEDMAQFNLHRIKGESFVFDDFYQVAQSMPFMSDYSCVTVKDLAVDKMSDSDFDVLLDFLSDPPETCVIIFWMDRAEVNEKKSKSRKFIKAIDDAGVVVSLDKMRGTALYKLLENGAKKRGCEMSRDSSSYLVKLVGDELNVLLNEMDKLCYYKGEGEITRQDIDKICIRSLDAKVFDLSKVMARGTVQQAFDILSDLMAQKESSVAILGTLISAYVDMYRVQIAMSTGENATAPAQIFNYSNKAFRLNDAARNSAQMSLEQIRLCLEILAQADSKLKSTAFDERRILEETVLRLMQI